MVGTFVIKTDKRISSVQFFIKRLQPSLTLNLKSAAFAKLRYPQYGSYVDTKASPYAADIFTINTCSMRQILQSNSINIIFRYNICTFSCFL